MTGAPASPRTHRSELLDCIRAVAIVMVVFFHVSTRHVADLGMSEFERFFLRWGSKGVDIFFPLSGYLITLFLLSSKRADFVQVFFLRRAFRILPIYFVAVTLALIGMYVLGRQEYLIDRSWINYTFLTAWFIHFQGPGTVPYTISWSLSVEEFAYILFGLVAWISRRHLPAFLAAATLMAIAVKLHLAAAGQGFYFLPIARLDSIAIGGVAAWLTLSGRRPLLWLSLALGVCFVGHALSQTVAIALTYTEIALIVCILIVAFQRWAANLHTVPTAAIAAVGFYSYFTYLFHLFVIDGLYTLVPDVMTAMPFWLAASVCFALTHVAAIVSYRWFEGPVMRYGRRLESRGGAEVRASSEAVRRNER